MTSASSEATLSVTMHLFHCASYYYLDHSSIILTRRSPFNQSKQCTTVTNWQKLLKNLPSDLHSFIIPIWVPYTPENSHVTLWKEDHFKRKLHLPTMKFRGTCSVFRGVNVKRNPCKDRIPRMPRPRRKHCQQILQTLGNHHRQLRLLALGGAWHHGIRSNQFPKRKKGEFLQNVKKTAHQSPCPGKQLTYVASNFIATWGFSPDPSAQLEDLLSDVSDWSPHPMQVWRPTSSWW